MSALVSQSERPPPPAPAGTGARKLTERAFRIRESGIIVVLVACQRGFETTSGPRGVANAVNASVVVGVLSAFIVNVLATQLVSMFLPQRLG